MSRWSTVGALAVFLLFAGAPVVLAQQSEDPVETARVRIGPFGLTPSIAVRDLGVDSNVFNEVFDPKRDFTFTVSPAVDTWFRAGRSRLSVRGQGGPSVLSHVLERA